MQSIHKSALVFVGVLLVAIFGIGINILPVHAKRTVPTDVSGTWQGQGTYNSGQNQYDMLLDITAVNGNTFSGMLVEDTLNSSVAINGSITNSSGSNTITFTDPSTISGGQIALNCTYTATISNGQMNGFWQYSGDSSPDGTISLSTMPTPDFSSGGTDAQSAQLQQDLSNLANQPHVTADMINKLVTAMDKVQTAEECARGFDDATESFKNGEPTFNVASIVAIACTKQVLGSIAQVFEQSGDQVEVDNGTTLEQFIQLLPADL